MRKVAVALIVAVAGIALAGVVSSRLRPPVRTPALGAVAGLGYGVLAVAARVLPGFSPHHLIRDPAAYALAAPTITWPGSGVGGRADIGQLCRNVAV